MTSSYLMPAEWAPHAATWCAFPFKEEEHWPGILNAVRTEYAEFIKTIAKFETVHLFVNDDPESLQSAHALFDNVANVHLHATQIDDVWYRDNGPTFVKTSDGFVLPIKWKFNAWGNKFPHTNDAQLAYKTFDILNCDHKDVALVFEGGGIEVNGQGVALTTRQCLLNPNRNPGLTQTEIEQKLKDCLGIERCIWLENGLEDDHTDGHIDTIARFANENTIICSYCEDHTDPNYATMQRNLEILETANTNNQFKIVMLPLPRHKVVVDGKRLASTYANFYMSDKFVIMPVYSDPNDNIALNILKSTFPNHQVFGISSKFIIHGGGSFHCMTQQQPAGSLKPIPKPVKIAMIQMSMTDILEENLDKAFKCIREAAKNGAKIILLPELFENLYFCQEKNEKYFALANEFKNHPFLNKFQTLAQELNVVLPVSFFEKSDDKYFNSIAMINSDGKCLGLYRKTHIPDDTYYEEKFYFQPGDTGFKVWDTAYGRIGVGICWDQWFPECARSMTLLGADLLLYPTAIGSEPAQLNIDTRSMWQRVMIGHAVANSVYLAAVNRVGTENNIKFYGSSFICDYTGEKIAEAKTSDEVILYADCDLKKANQFRSWIGCLRDRRPNCYL